jgi:hypothetical protein
MGRSFPPPVSRGSVRTRTSGTDPFHTSRLSDHGPNRLGLSTPITGSPFTGRLALYQPRQAQRRWRPALFSCAGRVGAGRQPEATRGPERPQARLTYGDGVRISSIRIGAGGASLRSERRRGGPRERRSASLHEEFPDVTGTTSRRRRGRARRPGDDMIERRQDPEACRSSPWRRPHRRFRPRRACVTRLAILLRRTGASSTAGTADDRLVPRQVTLLMFRPSQDRR